MVGYIFLLIMALALMGFLIGLTRGKAFATSDGLVVHSRPGYHGAYIAIWVGLPPLLLVFVWLLFRGAIFDALVWQSLPDSIAAGTDAFQRRMILAEVKNVSAGIRFRDAPPAIDAAAAMLVHWQSLGRSYLLVSVLLVALSGLFLARMRLTPRFRARIKVERLVDGVMMVCSAVAVLTTIGIVLSLLYEASAFFRLVPPHEFFFGLRWEPQIAIRTDQVAGTGAFGAIPVFFGTLLIALIALVVATPTGLFSAIYLAEYAPPRVRQVIKPTLEILAGIPTIVYGFFAVLVVAPAVRRAGDAIGFPTSPNSALGAGLVLGIMIVPFISSLSDDALRAVPRSLRDGALAMGATRAEAMTGVLLPAALPGILGEILLAFSRAIGETMIVVMAAGLMATITLNPLNSVTTVTVQIVTLLVGDTEFSNPKTLSAFALGLVLFLVTLCVNVMALAIVRRYREQYE